MTALAMSVRSLTRRPREVALLGLVVAFAAFIPSFREASNLKNLLSQASPLLLLAIGQTFVLLVGGIDLTQGALVGLASVAFAYLANAVGPVNAIVVVVVFAFAFGLANGNFIARSRIDPLIATLAGMYVLTGVTMLWTGGTPITDLSSGTARLLRWTGGSSVGMLPTMFLVALLFAILAHLFLARVLVGLQLFAVGSNPKAAAALGLKASRLHGIAYGLSAAFAALASMLLTARIQQGNPHLGEGLLFESIGSAVLGGVALAGGVGGAWSAARGVATLALIQNGLYLTDLNSHVRDVVVGVLIVAGVLFARRAVRGGTT